MKKRCLNFAKKILSISSAKFKVNTFTLFTPKSKQIELQRSAWWHLMAFLKRFPTVSGFPRVFFIILMKCDKNWRTLILNKIVPMIYFSKNANFGHFGLFLASFWPDMAPVSVFKAQNEYIWHSLDWIEWDKRKILITNDLFDRNADFGHFGPFWAILGLFLICYSPLTATKLLLTVYSL